MYFIYIHLHMYVYVYSLYILYIQKNFFFPKHQLKLEQQTF